jgi:hypothetical protein
MSEPDDGGVDVVTVLDSLRVVADACAADQQRATASMRLRDIQALSAHRAGASIGQIANTLGMTRGGVQGMLLRARTHD